MFTERHRKKAIVKLSVRVPSGLDSLHYLLPSNSDPLVPNQIPAFVNAIKICRLQLIGDKCVGVADLDLLDLDLNVDVPTATKTSTSFGPPASSLVPSASWQFLMQQQSAAWSLRHGLSS